MRSWCPAAMRCGCAWPWPRKACRSAARSATSCSTGPTRSRPATFWATSTCGVRSRASSPAPSARCAASVRRGSIIVVPERSLFGREEVKPTASIVLALRGAAAARQAPGRRHPPSGGGRGAGPRRRSRHPGRRCRQPAGRADRGRCRPARSPAMRKTIARPRGPPARPRSCSCSSVGRAGKVDAAVSADLDFDEVATTAELYDPQSQVARSTQTTEEASDQKESQPADAVSAANNLPTERAASGGPAAASSEQDQARPRRPSTTRSRARSATRPSAGPSLRKLSIAVQVDGIYRDAARRHAGLRAARRRRAGAAGGAGAQRGRHRREPRRRGRGGQPAVRRWRPAAEPSRRAWLAGPAARCAIGFGRSRRARPADPGRAVLRRSPGRQAPAGRRQPPARQRRPRPRSCSVRTASRCWCTVLPAPPSASIAPAIRSWCASRSRSTHRPRATGRAAWPWSRPCASELVDSEECPRPGARLTAWVRWRKAIDDNPDDAVRVVRGWLHGRLGGAMSDRASYERLSGAEKASIMMLALSEADAARLFGLLDHQEVMEISQTMAVLGRVEAGMVEQLLDEFNERLSSNGGVVGRVRCDREAAAAGPRPRSRRSDHAGDPRPGGPDRLGQAGPCQRGGARLLPEERIPADRGRRAVADRAGACRPRPDQPARRFRDRGGDADAADGGGPDARSWPTSSGPCAPSS